MGKYYTLDETDKEQILQTHQEQYYKNLEEELRNNNNPRIQIVYRGDRLNRLAESLLPFVPERDQLVGMVAQHIFYFGAKGKFYYQDRVARIDGIPQRKYLVSINDSSTNTIEFIFDRMYHIIQMRLNYYQQEKLNQALGYNQEIQRFFSDKKNKRVFVSAFNRFDDRGRIYVRDYYLRFLHSLNSSFKGIDEISYFISTSKDYKEARYFANVDKEKGILIHYFVPLIMFEQQIVFSGKQYERVRLPHGLPEVNQSPFPKTNEYFVKGALLPTFILKIEILNDNKTIINPHLFTEENQNRDINEVLNQGILIDHSNFLERIAATNYNSYGAITTDYLFQD